MKKIEKEGKLFLLRKELATLNTRPSLSQKEHYHRKMVMQEIEALEKALIPAKPAEYPTETLYSPRGKVYEYDGKIVNMKGKRKLVVREPKPYQPLKGDTISGYGEKRKRYSR